MLTAQLEDYTSYSQNRKRNYAIHGIHCNGAFHPKIIFLTGTDSILLLLGSGNMTTSGHGKNLEVWNSIYIDKQDDIKFGFVFEAWNYIKTLHSDLGESAKTKIKNIEDNCFLLSDSDKVEYKQSYDLGNSEKISFVAPSEDNSIFKQVATIIGTDKIAQITLMSPYYDADGDFIQELNTRFNPDRINIVFQKKFGLPPYKMKPKTNMSFYDWEDIQIDHHRQKYFHAKNIIFQGKMQNYLLSGSTNGSVAAFGTLTQPGVNQETCILYQTKTTNFIKLLGLNLQNRYSKVEFNNAIISDDPGPSEGHTLPIFIKSAEKKYNKVTLYIFSKE
jgi:hypothetical protein